jgi:hypothetical protein
MSAYEQAQVDQSRRSALTLPAISVSATVVRI